MSEPTFLVCADASDDHHPIEGTVTLFCSKCQRPVSVAPTGQALMASESARLICITCALPGIKSGKSEIRPPTDAQIKEVMRAIHRSREGQGGQEKMA